MQKVFNYRDASNYFRTKLSDFKLDGQSFVFIGREGTGKTQLLNVIEKRARIIGYQVFRARSYSSNEALMYQAYNELLNQVKYEFKERALPEIVDAFSSFNPEDARKTIFMIDGLENMLQHSRELFIYLSRIAVRLGFTIFGTITEDYVEEGYSVVRFLNLVSQEPDIQITKFEKANIEDIKFLLKEAGYNLPASFIQEVFRLTNGNVRSLVYTLRYYEDQGIINEKQELEEVTFRYFPIPPSSEMRFEQIIGDLNEIEMTVLEVVSLIQEELAPSFIADLTQYPRKEIVNALTKLNRFGLLMENNLNYSILNSSVADIVLKSIYSRGGYVISENFVKQEVFKALPFITKLKVHELRKDPASIEDLVNSQWRDLVDRMGYLGVSQELFIKLQKSVTGKEAKAHLALMAAQSMQEVGDFESAMQIYLSEGIVAVEPVYAKLSEAKLHQKFDRFQESIDACNEVLKMGNVGDYDYVSALIVISTNYSALNRADQGEKYANDALALAREHGFKDLESDALGTIGTLRVRRFDLEGALSNYETALDITQKAKYFDRELLVLNNIAIIHSYWGEFEESARMLTEIIEKSYMSGELISRAYATYNLCEIYYNTGRKEDFRSYFPSAAGLVRLLSDSNLSYPFFRFATLASIDMMNIESGSKYSEELLKISRSLGDENKEIMARGLYIMTQKEFSRELATELEDIFSKDINDPDDFLPSWFLISLMYHCLRGNREQAHLSFVRLKKVSETLGDSLGMMVAELGAAFDHLLNGNLTELGNIGSKGFLIGGKTRVFPVLARHFEHYSSGTLTEEEKVEIPDTIVNLTAMILMGEVPAGIPRDEGMDNFNYFMKCREIVGKKTVPI